eukprot:scaffold180924_cov37-Attheya_sp.AAC.1
MSLKSLGSIFTLEEEVSGDHVVNANEDDGSHGSSSITAGLLDSLSSMLMEHVDLSFLGLETVSEKPLTLIEQAEHISLDGKAFRKLQSLMRKSGMMGEFGARALLPGLVNLVHDEMKKEDDDDNSSRDDDSSSRNKGFTMSECSSVRRQLHSRDNSRDGSSWNIFDVFQKEQGSDPSLDFWSDPNVMEEWKDMQTTMIPPNPKQLLFTRRSSFSTNLAQTLPIQISTGPEPSQ